MCPSLFIFILLFIFVFMFYQPQTEHFWDLSDDYVIKETPKCQTIKMKPTKSCNKECQCKTIDDTLRTASWNNDYDPVYAYNIWKKAYSECN